MAHVNLIRDDYELVAERISATVRSRVRKQMVVVGDTGKVCIDDPCRLADRPTHSIIGTYDRSVRIEHLEGDLIERLREMRDYVSKGKVK